MRTQLIALSLALVVLPAMAFGDDSAVLRHEIVLIQLQSKAMRAYQLKRIDDSYQEFHGQVDNYPKMSSNQYLASENKFLDKSLGANKIDNLLQQRDALTTELAAYAAVSPDELAKGINVPAGTNPTTEERRTAEKNNPGFAKTLGELQALDQKIALAEEKEDRDNDMQISRALALSTLGIQAAKIEPSSTPEELKQQSDEYAKYLTAQNAQDEADLPALPAAHFSVQSSKRGE